MQALWFSENKLVMSPFLRVIPDSDPESRGSIFKIYSSSDLSALREEVEKYFKVSIIFFR